MIPRFLLAAVAVLFALPDTTLLGAAALPALDDVAFHQLLARTDAISLRSAMYAFQPLHEILGTKNAHEAVRELRITDPARADRLLRLARRQNGTGGGSVVVVTSTTTNPPPSPPPPSTTVFSTTTLPPVSRPKPNIPTPPAVSTPVVPAPAQPGPSNAGNGGTGGGDGTQTTSDSGAGGAGGAGGAATTSVVVVTGVATETAPGVSTAVTVVTANGGQEPVSTSATASGSLQTPNAAIAQVPLRGAAVGLLGGVMVALL